VDWIPVYQILESRGLEVCLVNAAAGKEGLRRQAAQLGFRLIPVQNG
jgi:hypothetical protein